MDPSLRIKRVLQPNDVLEQLGVKAEKTTLKAMSGSLSLLVSLREGDTMKTSFAEFTKLSDDLIHIKSDIKHKEIIDTLEHNEIIHLPV